MAFGPTNVPEDIRTNYVPIIDMVDKSLKLARVTTTRLPMLDSDTMITK